MKIDIITKKIAKRIIHEEIAYQMNKLKFNNDLENLRIRIQELEERIIILENGINNYKG